MKRVIITTICAIAFVLIPTTGQSQIGMSSTIQTNHLWRGGEVADGIVITYDAAYKMLNESLSIGFWGAINAVGEYKEFNYYATYSVGGFKFSLWDIYNFSDYATYNNSEFFNYCASSTGRFLDATAAYSFGDKFPLTVSWSTILFGRDRDSENSANRYSTYCYAEYPVYKTELWRVDTGLGAAFALNPMDENANFYGDKAGIVHISMAITRDLVICNYHIPISGTALWNPQSNKAYFQLAAKIFSF